MPDRLKSDRDQMLDMTEEAVAKMDAEAKRYTGPIPDVVLKGIAHAVGFAVTQIPDMRLGMTMLDMLMVIGRNAYRIGYANGQRDTETKLNVGRG